MKMRKVLPASCRQIKLIRFHENQSWKKRCSDGHRYGHLDCAGRAQQRRRFGTTRDPGLLRDLLQKRTKMSLPTELGFTGAPNYTDAAPTALSKRLAFSPLRSNVLTLTNVARASHFFSFMKTILLFLSALLLAATVYCQPASAPPAVVAKDTYDYLIHIEWNDLKGDPKTLEVLTTDGQVEYDGLQKTSVKINNNDIPVTLKLTGTLTVLDWNKGRLQLYLGRTVPYVTGTSGSGFGAMSSYSQMSVGLQATYIVTFGKPLVIQSDENGTISVLVKRLTD
jgi:hypothetical protein